MITSEAEEMSPVSLDGRRMPIRVIDPETMGNSEDHLYNTLMVEPGSKVRLSDIDPGYCGDCHSFERTLPIIQAHADKLFRLQYLMHAGGKNSLLIVLQSLDAGGKDGVTRHIMTCVNPAGCRVAAFRQPTQVELDHDFLWRVHAHVPARGEMVVFNRSHYEDVLAARVHGVVPETIWSRRYGLINDFEKLLAIGNDTKVIKFFLHISKDEQLKRFKQRLNDPQRRWKISDADYREREHWDDYVAALEEMLYRTSSWHAPWFVIPADNKWFRNLAVSRIIAATLENLDMTLPEPKVDLSQIRRRYHEVEAGLRP
jgi:PPK2 family polyphosphate:nucleotide phosphotransferase